MPRYSLAIDTVAATTAHAFGTIHTGANLVASIVEMGFFTHTNPVNTFNPRLGIPANTPVATTSTLGLAEDPSKPVSTVNMDTAWSTAPTAPAAFYRGFVQATGGGTGTGIIWTFPNGLIIPVSSWLCLWNTPNSGVVMGWYAVWDE